MSITTVARFVRLIGAKIGQRCRRRSVDWATNPSHYSFANCARPFLRRSPIDSYNNQGCFTASIGYASSRLLVAVARPIEGYVVCVRDRSDHVSGQHRPWPRNTFFPCTRVKHPSGRLFRLVFRVRQRMTKEEDL